LLKSLTFQEKHYSEQLYLLWFSVPTWKFITNLKTLSIVYFVWILFLFLILLKSPEQRSQSAKMTASRWPKQWCN